MKRGFTLVELLAVMSILALLALITTPVVIRVINNAEEDALFKNAFFYLDAVEISLLESRLDEIIVQDGIYSILESGNICIGTLENNICDGNILKVSVKGDKPTNGTIKIKDGEISTIILKISGKDIVKNAGGEFAYYYAPGLYDKKKNLLLSWEELEEEYDVKALIEKDWSNGTENAGQVLGLVENAYMLVMDESVTKIGNYAFYNCKNLLNVIIPDSVESIGTSAFEECSNLESATIQDGVIYIYNRAFYNCTSLTSITIPSSVKKINNSTFSGCSSLKSVVISDGVIEISGNAFRECISLTSITIPSSVNYIYDNVFARCTSLTKIYYKGTATGKPWRAPNATVVTDF